MPEERREKDGHRLERTILFEYSIARFLPRQQHAQIRLPLNERRRWESLADELEGPKHVVSLHGIFTGGGKNTSGSFMLVRLNSNLASAQNLCLVRT